LAGKVVGNSVHLLMDGGIKTGERDMSPIPKKPELYATREAMKENVGGRIP